MSWLERPLKTRLLIVGVPVGLILTFLLVLVVIVERDARREALAAQQKQREEQLALEQRHQECQSAIERALTANHEAVIARGDVALDPARHSLERFQRVLGSPGTKAFTSIERSFEMRWYEPDFGAAEQACRDRAGKALLESRRKDAAVIVATYYRGNLEDDLVWLTVRQPFRGSVAGLRLSDAVPDVDRRTREIARRFPDPRDTSPARRLVAPEWKVSWKTDGDRLSSLWFGSTRFTVETRFLPPTR